MSDVLVARSEGVVTLTLNRPQRKNALTGDLVEEAISVLEEIARTPDDRAVVVTGAGGAFCSGMDLGAPLLPDELSFMRRVGQLCTLLHDLPRPTIAKVAGPAIGFGCNFALCCDLVVAADDAVFGETFANLGISADGGASWSLPRLIGVAKSKELLFFGRQLSGKEAAEIGIANRAVPATELDVFVQDWAQTLADGPTSALAMMKSLVNVSTESSFRQAIDRETLSQSVSFKGQEARVAGRARMKKQVPNFRNP
ncbi:enoyl-CoA hydratase/isomerase family protein [Rhodococcus sp. JVH1]|uniref:enoyl-CoA hydratase/isomerase family protein n=1 Tax=Rhodococcus sp. JVH1 TaxID=745408 RepID=UPI000271F923|nr:enoyl-CoA hydratase-related protein [Rhodococcus sp. JVH1]EJI98466.1 enoyl-CoA hydratase/isomerase family protein [Rhodococcus sp. JVH1]